MQSSFDKFLEPEDLSGNDQKFCDICNVKTDTVREIAISDCAGVLFVSLFVPLQYRLVGQVCHSGQYGQCHYWVNVRRNGHWYYCNDEKVVPLAKHNLNNRNAYVLVYLRNISGAG